MDCGQWTVGQGDWRTVDCGKEGKLSGFPSQIKKCEA